MITTRGWGSGGIGTLGWGDRGTAGPKPTALRPDITDSLELVPEVSARQLSPEATASSEGPRPRMEGGGELRPRVAMGDDETPQTDAGQIKPRLER